jgi:hypothetical protein
MPDNPEPKKFSREGAKVRKKSKLILFFFAFFAASRESGLAGMDGFPSNSQ